MVDINDKMYNGLREWIKKARRNDYSWEKIESMADGGDAHDQFFARHVEEDFWPDDSKDIWMKVVLNIRRVEESTGQIKKQTDMSTLLGPRQKNTLDVPDDEGSCWSLYRNKLLDRRFSNVDSIQVECLNILQNLSSNTRNGDPVKGLVVGNVQSGKTANMAGLIAMAADCGWNFFIVLSGTIDSLRVQTRNRLYRDLCDENIEKFVWQSIDRLNIKNSSCTPQRLNLKSGGNVRYLTVCLKNKKRLTDMLTWINVDPNKKKQMKILLIDDEADQASINTAPVDEERKTINRLILNIVNGEDSKGKKPGPYGAMNYVAYTATPYANFLSEGSEKSLYPRDFISLLTPPNLYFGPEEIYGSENRPGLDIINTYENVDEAVLSLEKGRTEQLPDGLKDATCWFICCVAVLRAQYFNGPVSMLVHTSSLTDCHDKVATAINSYLTTERSEVISRCERVYHDQVSKLSLDKFHDEYDNYEMMSEIHNYPEYSEISNIVKSLVSLEPSHIKIDEDLNRIYYECIHICIDNNKKMTLDDDENSMPRLLYPDENTKDCPPVPAFIVVGGNTLSRGLTVEGLVSTYFARVVSQADTLMQMGRWFGYRIGYELLPRMWMSKLSKQSFDELVDLDVSLRDFIRENYNLMTPEDFPPKVKNFPKTSYLKKVTSPGKMRAAEETGYDFDGTLMDTNSFPRDEKSLESNIRCAEDFIKGLGRSERSEITEALVWHHISGERIFDQFMQPFIFSKRQKTFQMLDGMRLWIRDKADYYNWNVVLAGVKNGKHGSWDITDEVSINKVERGACNSSDEEDVYIGSTSLSSPLDRIADIDLNSCTYKEGRSKVLKNLNGRVRSEWRKIREEYGINNIPTLIIYCLSKDYIPSAIDGPKKPLDVSKDIIALTVIMPGMKQTKLKAKYLQIPPGVVRGEE